MRRKFLDCCSWGNFSVQVHSRLQLLSWAASDAEGGETEALAEGTVRIDNAKFIPNSSSFNIQTTKQPKQPKQPNNPTTIIIHWELVVQHPKNPNTVQGRARSGFIRRLPTPDRVLVKLIEAVEWFCRVNPRVTCVTSQGPDRQGWLWDASLPGVRSSPYTAPFFRARHSRRRVVNVVSMSMVWCLQHEDKVSLSNIE